MRPSLASIALAALASAMCVATAPRTGCAEAAKLGVSVTFADSTSLERYRDYVAFLSGDPVRFDAELATLARLERSDVTYVVRVGGRCASGVEGNLTTDGQRIFVTVSDQGGAFGETASLNSRLAHELEHARQFDAGELAFVRDGQSQKWHPIYGSYDIGDEVKAWAAQLRASNQKDYWYVTDRKRKPSLLQLFAAARDDEQRAATLRQHGYADRYPVPDADVVFTRASGFVAGDLVRPDGALAVFGRVRRIV